jgi:hypothetical protein
MKEMTKKMTEKMTERVESEGIWIKGFGKVLDLGAGERKGRD